MNLKYKVNIVFLFCLLVFICNSQILPGQSGNNNLYVSPNGDDSNDGTFTKPLKTIRAAYAMITPGTIINLRAGIYNESVDISYSGTPGTPLIIKAYEGEEAIISGGEPVTGTWTRINTQSPIWRIRVPQGATSQIFMNGNSMIEARWPNMKFHENWDPSKKWAKTGNGTQFGFVKSDEIALLNVDLTGGLVFIKVGKGNDCFSRTISDHHPGGDEFKWDTVQFIGKIYTGEDGEPVKMESFGYIGNKYFVTGKLGLLDAPDEWFYDPSEGWLYFYPPDGMDPNKQFIEIKKRVSGFRSSGSNNVKLTGLSFRGCNVNFTNCNSMEINNCSFIYPSYRIYYFNRLDKTKDYYVSPVYISGDGNTVTNCEISWASEGGIEVLGPNSIIENCVIHDCNLHGKHPGPALTTSGPDTKISRCTIYNCGGVGIYSTNQGPVITEKVNVFNCGIHCVDVSGYYIPYGKLHNGSVTKYSWYHNINGIGMRCDSYGTDITSHHNVVWDCKSRNCKWEGYSFNICNNTYVAPNDSESGLMFVLSEGASFEDFNTHNNITLYRIYQRDNGQFVNLPDNGANFSHNLVVNENELNELFINSLEPYDWRPKNSSVLIDAGIVIPGISDNFSGNAPDLGAYEAGGEYWIPGADWLPGDLKVPASITEAEEMAAKLQNEWTKDESPPDTSASVSFQVRVILTDIHTGSHITDGNVDFGSFMMSTDDSGEAIYTGIKFATYVVTCTAPGYLPSSTPMSIFSDTTIHISLSHKILADTWLTIVDRVTGVPLNRAVLTLESQVLLTNITGIVHIEDLPHGTFSFKIEHNEYFPLSDSIIIQGDTSLVISLTKKLANICFELIDLTHPVENALVSFNNWCFYSKSNGKVLFLNQQSRKDYEYFIEKEGYQTITGSLYLEIDTLIRIFFTPATTLKNISCMDYRIYPNPVKEMLNITSSGEKGNMSLIDLNGKVMLSGILLKGDQSFDLTGMHAGIYLLQIKSKDFIRFEKIIKL